MTNDLLGKTVAFLVASEDGGSWVDEAVVAGTNGPNTLVTSRKPDDLDSSCSELVRGFAGHGRRPGI